MTRLPEGVGGIGDSACKAWRVSTRTVWAHPRGNRGGSRAHRKDAAFNTAFSRRRMIVESDWPDAPLPEYLSNRP